MSTAVVPRARNCGDFIAVDGVWCTAVEWLGHKQGSRAVLVTLDETKQRIVVKEDRRIVRTIDLSRLDKAAPVTIMLSADVEMKLMLIRIPKEYDLVRSQLDQKQI